MLPGELPPWRIVYTTSCAGGRTGAGSKCTTPLRDALRQWSGKKKPQGLRYSTRKALDVLTTEAGAAMMRAKRSWDENDGLVVDTLGLILGVLVTPANVSDPAGAAQLLPEVVARFGRVRHLWADRTYSGLKIMDQLQEWFPRRGLRLEVVRAKEGVKGFAVQPHRWIIERTFAWLTQNRRLFRDYEEFEVNSEAVILLAASRLMLKRLAAYLY